MILYVPPSVRSLAAGVFGRVRGFGGTIASNPAAPVATTISVGPSSAAFALGDTQQFTATVRDQFGQVMGGQTVSWGSNSGNVTINSSSGLATGAAYGSATITATSGSLSNTASATCQQPTQLAMITQPAGAITGSQFGTQPVVELRDGSNGPDGESGRTVTVSILSGTGSLGGTTSINTDGSGRAVFTNLTITGTGTFSLAFACTGLTGVNSSSFTVSAAGGEGEPIFPGQSSLWFPTSGANFYDLSQFTSVAQLNSVSGLGEGIKVVTESEYAITNDYPGTTGGRSLRAIFTLGGNQQTRTIYVTPEGGTKYTPAIASVVMEMECRLTNGWAWSGDGMKFFECWFNTLPGRIQFAPTGGPPARFHVHWSQNPIGGAAAGEIAFQPMAGEPTWANAFAIGQKIVFKVRLRPNTVQGGNDGAATMWVRLASDADGTARRVLDISAQGQADGFCTAAERTYLPWGDISYFKFPDVWNTSGGSACNADYHYFRAWKE